MDKKQFINELRNRLSSLPYDEREKAISYYEEYFDDAGAENEDSVVYELGDIEKIAQEIIENSSSNADSISVNKFTISGDSDYIVDKNDRVYGIEQSRGNNKNNSYSYKESYNEKQTKGKREMKPVYIVLIILGAIVAFPIIMTLFGLVMGLFGAIIGVIGAAFGIAISGIVAIFSIPFVGLAAIGSTLYYLGKGILSIALLIVIFIVIIKLIKAIIDFIKNREE